ncbi:MAG: AAA family ATPase [Bacteroidota bacterium]|nr:AAA family ATPase [Bacteroidota bacterium]
MEQLVKKHRILLANLKFSFRRKLIDQISWKERMIGIKGSRGVGKTTMILQYIKEKYQISEECLYVNLDDLNFPFKNLIELAEKFTQTGGKILFIDEIHKQSNWIVQLKNIYDFFPNLKIVFTGSSILELDHSKADLSRRVVMYNMQGLSFREFLQIETEKDFSEYNLSEIVENHEQICFDVVSKIKPLKYFSKYIRYGYYPFYLQNIETYSIKLSELINLIVEHDLSYITNIDVEHFTKIKRFLYLLSHYVPVKPNISSLASEMGMSRTTIINYIHYLQKADVLSVIYSSDKKFKSMSKPEKVLLHHPNLYFAINSENANIGSIRETFFANQMSYNHTIEIPQKGDFFVNNKYTFEVGGKNKSYKQIADIENSYIVADDIEIGLKNKIPLWLFGFLY